MSQQDPAAAGEELPGGLSRSSSASRLNAQAPEFVPRVAAPPPPPVQPVIHVFAAPPPPPSPLRAAPKEPGVEPPPNMKTDFRA